MSIARAASSNDLELIYHLIHSLFSSIGLQKTSPNVSRPSSIFQSSEQNSNRSKNRVIWSPLQGSQAPSQPIHVTRKLAVNLPAKVQQRPRINQPLAQRLPRISAARVFHPPHAPTLPNAGVIIPNIDWRFTSGRNLLD